MRQRSSRRGCDPRPAMPVTLGLHAITHSCNRVSPCIDLAGVFRNPDFRIKVILLYAELSGLLCGWQVDGRCATHFPRALSQGLTNCINTTKAFVLPALKPEIRAAGRGSTERHEEEVCPQRGMALPGPNAIGGRRRR